MTALTIPVVSTDRFTWHPDSATFAADASDLGDFVGRVYDDAVDLGFELESASTGARVLFVLLGEERDAEGELLCNVFAPADATALAALVRVFND